MEPQTNGDRSDPSPMEEGVVSLVKDVGMRENGNVPSPSQEDPPALVSTTMEAKIMKDMNVGVDSTNSEMVMETDDRASVASRSDREDSPDLVIVTQPEEEAPVISSHPVEGDAGEMSGEEIDPNVPLEESSDDDGPPLPHTSHPHQDHTPHLKYVASLPVNGSPVMTGKSSREPVRRQRSTSPGHRTKQVAKLKQFFTTLQGFGNKLGSEAAEQVQELITALVVSVLVLRSHVT